jgi:hypothetical protein
MRSCASSWPACGARSTSAGTGSWRRRWRRSSTSSGIGIPLNSAEMAAAVGGFHTLPRAVVVITWPSQPTPVRPEAYGDTAGKAMRILASAAADSNPSQASTELA